MNNRSPHKPPEYTHEFVHRGVRNGVHLYECAKCYWHGTFYAWLSLVEIEKRVDAWCSHSYGYAARVKQ